MDLYELVPVLPWLVTLCCYFYLLLIHTCRGLSFHYGSSPGSSSFSGLCCLRYSTSTRLLVAIFLMYSWMFVVSSWTVVLTLSSPWPPSFHLVYSLIVQLSIHGKELSCIDSSDFYCLLLPAYYPRRVFDHRQGIGVNCLALVHPIQLTPQDLPYSLQYLVVWAFLAASLWFPLACGIPRYL